MHYRNGYLIICFLIFLLTGIPELTSAQHFWNTDFEYEVYKSQPRKWAVEGEGKAYTAFVDDTQSHSGNKSLFMSLDNAETYTILSVPAKLLSGKQLSLSAYIKTKKTDSLQAQLILFDPAAGTMIETAQLSLDNTQWNSSQLSTQVPDVFTSGRLLLALMATGSGSFWFDAVEISINGKIYGKDKPDFREPDQEEIERLNDLAVPLNMDSETSGLHALSNILGDARFVALGENSHGSSTIYKLKLQMIRHLVEQEGFSVFALEMPTVEASYINDYIQYSKGTIDDVLVKLSYPSWQTQEMLDIIEWLRLYNEGSANKVAFMGYDMQNGWAAMEAVSEYARSSDSTLFSLTEELQLVYNSSLQARQPQPGLFDTANRVSERLNSNKYPGVSSEELAEIRHFMDILNQSIHYQFQAKEAKPRDAYMADNIRWIAEHYPDARIILSADNTHITRAGGKTGAYLSEWFRDDYLSIGFTFGAGTYAAYGPEVSYEVHPPYVGTYEYFFEQSIYSNFILDLRNTQEIPLLNKPGGFRAIGSRPQENTQFYEIDIQEHFDAVVYLERSVHTLPVQE